MTVHCRYPTITRARVDIRWTTSIGASSYEVFRDDARISTTLLPDIRRYSDENPPRGRKSTYSVRALSGQRTTSGNATLYDLETVKTVGDVNVRVGSVNVNGDSETYCFTDTEMDMATRYVTYAIFSSNVYTNKPKLDFPVSQYKWAQLGQQLDDKTGFFAQAFIDHLTRTVVVVFRGTDSSVDSSADWLYGNIGPVQYQQAITFADQVLNRFFPLVGNAPASRVVFTGHSLGGGLAQYVAKIYKERNKADKAKADKVQAIVFDSSEKTGPIQLTVSEDTVFISAKGEVLENFSIGGILRPNRLSLDFLNDGMVGRHNITDLACGLTYAAAARNETVWRSVAKQCDSKSAVRWWVN